MLVTSMVLSCCITDGKCGCEDLLVTATLCSAGVGSYPPGLALFPPRRQADEHPLSRSLPPPPAWSLRIAMVRTL